jgi:hypothetical protein
MCIEWTLHGTREDFLKRYKLSYGGFLWKIARDTAFLDMFVTCGEIRCAWKMFEEILEKIVVSWTGMLYEYAQLDHLSKLYLKIEEYLFLSKLRGIIIFQLKNSHSFGSNGNGPNDCFKY